MGWESNRITYCAQPGNPIIIFQVKPSVLPFLLLMTILLISPEFSWAVPSYENCVDEVCDGKDNDCDKSIDDNVDCGPKLQCGCANCNKEMENGGCAAGVPWQGFCLEDHCPTGTACNLKTGKCRPAGR